VGLQTQDCRTIQQSKLRTMGSWDHRIANDELKNGRFAHAGLLDYRIVALPVGLWDCLRVCVVRFCVGCAGLPTTSVAQLSALVCFERACRPVSAREVSGLVFLSPPTHAC